MVIRKKQSMEENKSLVSVVVPVYNTALYLGKCIASISNQTYRELEIICVDDGSTDGSGLILDGLESEDDRIKVIHRDKSSGSGAVPRNTGLNKANGKYVIFLDSDDYFDPTMIEKLVKRAEKFSADLVMCDSYNIDADGKSIDIEHTELHVNKLPKQDVFSYKDIPNGIFQISNAAVWHRLFLRQLLVDNKLRFQENVPILDDIFMANASLICAQKITVVPERLVFYRRNRMDGQTSGVDKHSDSIYKSFYAVYEYLKSYGDYNLFKVSFQTWVISTMKWWLGCIGNIENYYRLLKLYREEYIPGLSLMPADLSSDLDDYWKGIINDILNKELPMLCRSFIKFYAKEHISIVLYGAGEEGKKVYKAIKDSPNVSIMCWADKKVKSVYGVNIAYPEDIFGCKFDTVVIAINNPKIVAEIKESFIDKGLDESRILAVID